MSKIKKAIIIAQGNRNLPMHLGRDGILVWHRRATIFDSVAQARTAINVSIDLAKKHGINQKWLRMKVIPIANPDVDIEAIIEKFKQEAVHGE